MNTTEASTAADETVDPEEIIVADHEVEVDDRIRTVSLFDEHGKRIGLANPVTGTIYTLGLQISQPETNNAKTRRDYAVGLGSHPNKAHAARVRALQRYRDAEGAE